ncbi:2Fe-2S iron-sulfur cluster binding domain-containing protein [Rhodospirillaceae bacterium AH-315-P19]|nr:2Fe-2S iron-sulfur cluster binding domain-containing protein [Rhodospirillaceae bacterium AH-315-P19]
MHKVHCTFLDGKEISFECDSKDDFITGASLQNVVLPAYCLQGICGTCKGRLVSGEVEMGDLDPAAITPEEAEEDHILLCQAHPTSDVEIEFEYDSDRVTVPEKGGGEILEVGPVSPAGNVYHLVLKAMVDYKDEKMLFWNAGQYVALCVPDTEEWRMYSAANTPNMENRVEFYISILDGGAFSTYLKERAKVGDVIPGRGPFGLYHYCLTDRPPVFIAGGTGLGPNIGIIRQLATQFYPKRIRLFFGVTEPGDVFCKDEIAQLQEELPDFAPYFACANADEAWEGDKGYVTDSLLKQMAGEDFTDYEYYLCGPPAMVEAVDKILKEKNVDPSHVHREEFIASAGTGS